MNENGKTREWKSVRKRKKKGMNSEKKGRRVSEEEKGKRG